MNGQRNMGRARDAIIRHLKDSQVQERIQKIIDSIYQEATVTINTAARLSDLRENKLRDWERLHLLDPRRSDKGQRHYSLKDLQKLAIIKVLTDDGYQPGTIPENIDEIWKESQPLKEEIPHFIPIDYGHEDGYDHETPQHTTGADEAIDQRTQSNYEELFWRFYAQQAIRLSLLLLFENIPFRTNAALLLPLENKHLRTLPETEKLEEVGKALIGRLGRSGRFYTMFTERPSFRYPTDYHLLRLQEPTENEANDGLSWPTIIVMDRKDYQDRMSENLSTAGSKSVSLNLSPEVITTVQRLLSPIYNNAAEVERCFDRGMRDYVYDFANLNDGKTPLNVLNNMAQMLVDMGRRYRDGKYSNSWRFACIMLPDDTTLPLQRRSLIIRAQSAEAPYKLGIMSISPDKYVNSPGLKALQSGHIVYLPRITKDDNTIAFYDLEVPIGSALAIAVGSNHDQPLAVFYIVSEEEDDFTKDDFRVLRMIGKMIEELLLTYRMRMQITENMGLMIEYPEVTDTTFDKFASEYELEQDIEKLLKDMEGVESKEIAVIAIDVDKQSELAKIYGNRLVKNLNREMGSRIQENSRTLFGVLEERQPYHMYADRFCLLIEDVPGDLRERVLSLKEYLSGKYLSYRVSALSSPTRKNAQIEGMVPLGDVSVRLGVATYTSEKLMQLIEERGIAGTKKFILSELDRALEMGERYGGDVVYGLEPSKGKEDFLMRFVLWSEPEERNTLQ